MRGCTKAIRRLNQMLCERNGKTPQDRLTVSELLEAVIARTHHDLRC